jgi:hypothetical protein
MLLLGFIQPAPHFWAIEIGTQNLRLGVSQVDVFNDIKVLILVGFKQRQVQLIIAKMIVMGEHKTNKVLIGLKCAKLS